VILLTTSKTRIRSTLLAALLGGLAGGALVPSITLAAGPVAARAAFVAIAAGLVLVVRGARGAAGRTALAAAFGAGAAFLEGALPAGSAPALAGLGFGLVVGPEGQTVLARLLRAASAAAGALLGAVGVGALAHSPLGATPVLWDGALGAAIALGAAAGELGHYLLHVATTPPAELEEARAKLYGEARSAVDMARGAYVRACEAVIAARSLDAVDRIEALTTARDLAVTTARSSLAAAEVARTRASVNAGAADSEDVRATRERVTVQLDRKLAKARDDAARAATALAELAIAIAERGATQDTAAEELATRARGLAIRIHGETAGSKPAATPAG